MKISPFYYVAITTVLLITVTIMATMNFPFNWVFYVTIIGQLFVLIMVYKVLKDKYSTNKTFDDLYEDYPVNTIEI
ncbi:MAG: hypothetical protein COZ74_05180, partial [Flavobacteriaceae bacterium CG_4_8_14_3_um_filter_31_8]